MKQKRLVIRTIILLVMFIAIGYTFYNHFSEERGLVDQGDIAPNFAVEDLDGNYLELADLQGKGVYVNFWATWCSYCRDKMEYLTEYYTVYQEKGVEIVSVNFNERAGIVERHMERYNYNFPLYLDEQRLVSNAYGVVSLPTSFLIDENGVVIERAVGGKSETQVVAALEKLIPSN
ncbi:thiol-disulfide oxidoreductase ResA [Evansella tamaricis]|uniref:Thiol-disulfide oxidoreductase ResA n=1 Tax=Evansella tamaricis TaxID=2069301 RepID=A0ABS6JKU4_9BACI|nr:thiol-disulfide oxidoreductase ResA [Evansella tamaricis]MBU9714291.1 thiol-disulfide oxidoreductase ResA [Evansella tamaricis]